MARSSVRPVVADRQPERAGATALPPVSGSYAAAREEQPGRCPRASRRLKIAKRVSRSAGDYPVGEGVRDAVLFLSATSWTVMM